MVKIYGVMNTSEYGEKQIVGFCSSKDKAELAILGLTRYDWGEYEIQEFTIDAVFDEIKGKLEQEIDDLKQVESLLNKFNQF